MVDSTQVKGEQEPIVIYILKLLLNASIFFYKTETHT